MVFVRILFLLEYL